ncbi:MAG: SPASM domain-containing protein, partial [Candidatus Omnitrophica bacterium]|nr:SPASM domain-containing protein [Candidatus Omnitrophota bacterium]
QSKNIKTSLVTNGYATEENFSRLRMLKLHVVSVSIDGYRQKHDIVRGKPGSYERCLNSLKLYRKMGVRTRQVATVVLEENINDIQLMIKDAFAAGCTRYRLQLLIPEGRARNKKLPFDLVKKALYTINKERRKGRNVFAADNFGYLGPDESKLRPYNFFCGCGWWTFTIMENGDIMGCPLTDYPELSEGNIRNKDLKEIWRDGFQRFRDKSLVSLPDICQKCEYISICRGACWAQRVNTDRFCFLKLAKEIKLG